MLVRSATTDATSLLLWVPANPTFLLFYYLPLKEAGLKTLEVIPDAVVVVVAVAVLTLMTTIQQDHDDNYVSLIIV